MEGGGSAAVRAAQEPRRNEQKGAGTMRGRGPGVSARVRAPHGAGAVLVVLGGAVAGAAFLAWRRACRGRGGGDGGKNRREIKPVEEEVSDGGVVEDEQGGVSARNLDQLDENLSRDNVDVATNGLDGKATEELIQIQKDDEITADELVSKPVGNFDQNLSRNCAEITADDMDTESVKKVDENSGNNSIINEDTEGVDNSDENTLSISYPDIAQEEHNNHNDDSDERDNHNDDAHETASTETAPVTQVVLNEEQFSEEVEMATVAETEEVELSERTTMENNEFEQEEGNEFEQKEDNEFEHEEEKKNEFEQEEEKKNEFEQDEQKKIQFEKEEKPAELVGSPEYSSLPCLLKPTEKKGPVNRRWSETGMKLDQDYTNGELEEHELIKGGADHGVAVLAMDRRPTYMAILALIFAVAIGITIAMSLYVPSQQHDLQMNLQ